MKRTDLIDTDGENKAIRSFLRFYLEPGITIGNMRDNMAMSGWEGCWPASIGAAHADSTLTKGGTQLWLRHLFSLEAQFAPAPAEFEVRAAALPDYARDQAGAGGMSSRDVHAVDTRWEQEHQALIGNPAIKVVGRLHAALNPIPMQMSCPECGVAHVDEGPWATRLHKTHQCQACGHEWRPYEYPTVGVAEKVDTDRIEAICQAFMDGVAHGIERDGENSPHEDPALTAAYILGYDMVANPGTLVGALAEDRRLLEWLGKNVSIGTLDDFDQLTIKNSDKWEFLAPKGVHTDIREVLRAALARDSE